MKTSFLKRQSTWMYILLAILAPIDVYAFLPENRVKVEMPLLEMSADTSAIVLTSFNFGFETVFNSTILPEGWLRWGYLSYKCIPDPVVKHSGKYSLRIESRTKDIVPGEYGCAAFPIPAAKYAGKNVVTVKAFMKLEEVKNPIGLLLRIDDNNGNIVAIDNMQQRGITGTRDWKEYSITVDLPENAKTIYIGAIHSGKGKLWVDDFRVIIGQKRFVEKDFNLGFETVSYPAGLPDGWVKWGHPSYNIQIDSKVKHS